MPPGRAKKAVAKNKANAYKMPAPIPTGEVIYDPIGKKKWRIGPSIGVGGFGEIYSACEDNNSPKKRTEYPFVIKIEPHENGPLFVEKHFYIRNANKDDITKYMKTMNLSSLGMPTYFGNGSHVYKDEKYRYLVLERYGRDLWSIFKEAGRSFPAATVFIIGLQMLDVLEYIHSRGYVHADVKGANILLGLKKGTENQTYLVDFGLATRLNDKEFKPDPKCAHNGTIEYTSRDAHLGVATMRGDLEILGYNMLQWLVGELPWETSLKSPKVVQNKKESFMNNVRSNITSQYSDVPDALIKFMEYVSSMKPNDKPDYSKCRKLFEGYLKSEGKTRNSKLEFGATKKASSKRAIVDDSDETDETQNGDQKSKAKRPGTEAKNKKIAKQNGEIKPKVKKVDKEDKDDQNKAKRNNKRQSTETAAVLELKRAKLSPMATPPAKKNHANISTQTSLEKPRRSGRLAQHSPVGDVDGETPQTSEASANSSGDIFDDSFKIEDKKIKKKRKLVSDEKVTVKRVVRTTVTAAKKGKSWKDCPAVVNGRPPAK